MRFGQSLTKNSAKFDSESQSYSTMKLDNVDNDSHKADKQNPQTSSSDYNFGLEKVMIFDNEDLQKLDTKSLTI